MCLRLSSLTKSISFNIIRLYNSLLKFFLNKTFWKFYQNNQSKSFSKLFYKKLVFMVNYDRVSSFFNLFTLHPRPFPVLLVIIIHLFPPWIFFSHSSITAIADAQTTRLALLAISLLLVMLIRWLPSADRHCQSFNCCFSEKLLPLQVGGLILVLLFMGQYQHAIHEKWLIR